MWEDPLLARQIHIVHAKRDTDPYVPVLPALADELRTHLAGRQTDFCSRATDIRAMPHARYSPLADAFQPFLIVTRNTSSPNDW